tara:strand:+ start:665 stop:1585 length:921 start_codon:yes stop_codon:yes gene_type:complete
MKNIFIYGTGASAQKYISELPSNYRIISFLESNPTKESFMNVSVRKFPEGDYIDFDFVIIASMYYPEILELLIENNIPIEKIKIATSHKDDPRFGVLMINPKEVMKNIDKYKSFKEEVNQIEEFVNENNPLLIRDRLDHLKYCFNESNQKGHNFEFGVYKGESLLYLSSLSEKPVWGFDSFCGALEDSPWSLRENKTKPLLISDEIRDYKYLCIGFFHETLKNWIEENKPEYVSFLHYDAGDFEATCFVMEHLCPLMAKGSIIVFDEFIPSPTELRASEHDAFKLFCKQDFEIISRSGSSVGIKIK